MFGVNAARPKAGVRGSGTSRAQTGAAETTSTKMCCDVGVSLFFAFTFSATARAVRAWPVVGGKVAAENYGSKAHMFRANIVHRFRMRVEAKSNGNSIETRQNGFHGMSGKSGSDSSKT